MLIYILHTSYMKPYYRMLCLDWLNTMHTHMVSLHLMEYSANRNAALSDCRCFFVHENKEYEYMFFPL